MRPRPCRRSVAVSAPPFAAAESLLQFVENEGVGGVELDIASFEPPGMSGWRCFARASKGGFDLVEARAALDAEDFIGIAHARSLSSAGGYCDCSWRIGASTESGKVVIVWNDCDFPTRSEIESGAVGYPGFGAGQL